MTQTFGGKLLFQKDALQGCLKTGKWSSPVVPLLIPPPPFFFLSTHPTSPALPLKCLTLSPPHLGMLDLCLLGCRSGGMRRLPPSASSSPAPPPPSVSSSALVEDRPPPQPLESTDNFFSLCFELAFAVLSPPSRAPDWEASLPRLVKLPVSQPVDVAVGDGRDGLGEGLCEGRRIKDDATKLLLSCVSGPAYKRSCGVVVFRLAWWREK